MAISSGTATITIDVSGLRNKIIRLNSAVKQQAKAEVQQQTKALERALEAATRSAVGGNLWKVWNSQVYPKEGLATTPAGYVFPKGGMRTQGAIRAIANGARIRGRMGQQLAVPLPSAAGRFNMARGGRRANTLTPQEFERRTGLKLRAMPRRGKPTLLVVDKRSTEGLRYTRRSRNLTYLDGPREVVPVFVLLEQVTVRQRISIAAVVRPFGFKLVSGMQRRLKQIGAAR